MSNSKIKRRNFFKLSSTLAAGSVLSSMPVVASQLKNRDEKKIITRVLGNTGIELPVVNMGVMRSDNPNLVKAALETGMKHIDTAHHYMEGRNELMLGDLLKNYKRDSFVISTKILPVDYNWKNGTLGEGSNKDNFLERLDISLERLQMNYVDILYFHAVRSREVALTEHILDALQTAKKQGKAKHIGISTHSREPEVIQAAIDSGVYEVVLTSVNFKQKHRDLLHEKINMAAEKGIGIIGMKTMAGGFLDKERTKPINCKAALKWALQNENVHTTIPGITNFEMLAENASVMEDITITEEEKSHLEKARLEAGLYCNGCDECLKNCSKNIQIRDYMRAYMYAYGYNQPRKAKELLMSYGLPNNPCGNCLQCTVRCVNGFDVADRIYDISRLVKIPEDFLA